MAHENFRASSGKINFAAMHVAHTCDGDASLTNELAKRFRAVETVAHMEDRYRAAVAFEESEHV